MHRIPTRLLARRPASRPPFFYPPLLGERSTALSGHRVSRTVDGSIFVTDFTNTSSWVLGSGFTQDTSRPLQTARTSPVVPIVPGAIGTSDGGGCREPRLVDLGNGQWVLSYDAGDGTNTKPGTNWQQQYATSSDWGHTWTKQGKFSGLNHGGFDSYCTAGSRILFNGVWYSYILPANTNANGIPAEQYISQVYTSSSATGPWTWVRDHPLDSTGQPGDYDAYASMAYTTNGGANWVVFKSVRQNGGGPGNPGGYNVERFTTTGDPSGVLTADGNGACLGSAIVSSTGNLGQPENPTVWFLSKIGLWPMITNCVGSTSTFATDVYYAADPSNYQSSNTYRVRVQFCQDSTTNYDGINCVGMCTPVTGTAMNVLTESDGTIGIVWDTHGGTGFPNNHLGRSIWCGDMLAMPASLRFQSPNPGVDSPVWASLNIGSHQNFVGEVHYWQMPQGLTGAQNDYTLGFCCSNGNLTPDWSGDGYGVYFGAGAAVQILLWLGGAFQGFLTATTNGIAQAIDRRNIDGTNRIRWVRSSNTTFQIYLNEQTPGPTTNNQVGAGSFLKPRGNSYDSSISRIVMYKSTSVSITGAVPGTLIRMLGGGGIEFASATADGSGNATLTSTTYPMYKLQFGTAPPIRPPARPNGDNRIFGGDTYAFK